MVEAAGGDLYVYELKVEMVCGACSNAVKKVLNKCDDITEVTCEWESGKCIAVGKDGLDLVAMLQKWVSQSVSNTNTKICIVRFGSKEGRVRLQDEKRMNSTKRDTQVKI